jgi:hypothetical protein
MKYLRRKKELGVKCTGLVIVNVKKEMKYLWMKNLG